MESSLKEKLLEKAKNLSPTPGVYLMKGAESQILYVGKAKSLRSRVSSYFQSRSPDSPRTVLLVSRIFDFEPILTETESEALILENTLIKKYKPKFNVRLKDDKTYPYIRIQVEKDFPRLEWTRRVIKDSSRYFGPFPSAWSAKQVLFLLNETFQLRDCSDNTFSHRSRPCILFEMQRCTAPCVGQMSQENYHRTIQKVIDVLEGRGLELLEQLKQRMEDSSRREEYEEAAYYRDQVRNLEVVTETQSVTGVGSQTNRDVVAMARPEGEGDNLCQAVLLRIRLGKLVSLKHFNLQNVDSTLTEEEVYRDILVQHYLSKKNEEEGAAVIKEILLPVVPQDIELLEQMIGVSICVPRISENKEEFQLVQVAITNAKHALEFQSKKKKGHGIKALEEVQEKLQLEQLPHRIECYDISNIQGDAAVASRVVFIDGAPEKDYYRRYKIKTVTGQNDFAMMKEVLGRRFSRNSTSGDAFPNLVVVDGGKGQLSQAVAILEELNVQDIPVVGLAKARTEKGFQKKEVKSSSERVFIPNRKNPVILKSHTSAYRLLVHLRDEAHRFAITYHRLLRKKKTVKN